MAIRMTIIDEERIERFRLLFEEQNEFVYRYLYGLVGDAETARELAQEAFYRAFQGLDTFRGESLPSTWLCGIARNAALNHIRSRKYLAEAPPAEEPGRGEAPDRRVLSRELREAIRGALLDLDVEKREAFTLKIMHGKSYGDIAAITGSAIAKLKTDVHRARLHLRAALAPYLEGTR